MSLPKEVEIKCPQCGEAQKAVIWKSINATLDPKLKQALLDQEVNMFCCSRCDHEALIVTDLLYHDMQRQFWVQYYPFEWVEDDQFIQLFTPQGEHRDKASPAEQAAYVYRTPHIVFDMGELLRYVIFRDRLAGHGDGC